MTEEQTTAGDILKIYVMPPGATFPWVRLTHYPHGIRKKGVPVDSLNAHRDRDEMVRMIGEMVIRHSPILQEWTTTK
jgi:hypothetical protein